MKLFKQFEILINITIISIFLILFISTQDYNYAFFGYFVIGSIQLLSIAIHFFTGWFIGRTTARIIYCWFLVLLILLIPSGLTIFLLFFASPLLALIYVLICFHELSIIKFKEFVHLK